MAGIKTHDLWRFLYHPGLVGRWIESQKDDAEESSRSKAALSIFSWLTGRKVLPNAIAYNALLAACEAEGRWRWVLNLFETPILY